MLGRLRLLRRLSTLGIPEACCLLPTSSHSSPQKKSSSTFSALSAPPTASGAKRSRRSSLLHRLRNHGSKGFCHQAENEAGADSLFTPYLSVRIRCNKDDAVELSEALLCFGATSASMDELSNCEDLRETCITSIFADDQDVRACISHAAYSVGLSYIPNYEVSVGEHCDWVMKVQESFSPVEVTDGLWIIPKWCTPVDLQAITIILEPGMSFGTGEHPTTKLCLLLLHGLIKGGECFLDYGTGSGVLGIAAVKMGAALSIGIDIDPQAVTSARQNIALNKIDSNRMLVYQVPDKVQSHSDERTNKCPQGQTLYNVKLHAEKGKVDIVIANILLNPLLDLAGDIAAYGKPGAVIGVSGILSEQIPQIIERYSEYLDHISVSEMDGWACLSGTKKKR